MRILLAAILALSTLVSTASFASEFSEKSCEKYGRKASYAKALDVISNNMKHSSRSELCSLPHLFDVYITDRDFYNIETQEQEPHVWVTLHYAEHSCQYFVRNSDWVVTRKNCYNTL